VEGLFPCAPGAVPDRNDVGRNQMKKRVIFSVLNFLPGRENLMMVSRLTSLITTMSSSMMVLEAISKMKVIDFDHLHD
jgi:hypothetical protein